MSAKHALYTMNLGLVQFCFIPLLCFWVAIPASADLQHQALEDIERVGTGIFSWLADQAREAPRATREPAQLRRIQGVPTFDVQDIPVITAQDLESLLVPTYLDALPMSDPWGGAYEYRFDPLNFDGSPTMAVRSAGGDRIYSGTVYVPGFTSEVSEDLVWFDGMFVRRSPPPADEAEAYTSELLEQIALAVSSWRTDQVGSLAPRGEQILGLTGCEGYKADISLVPFSSADDLEARIAPGYITFLPRIDGWSNALDFHLDDDTFVDSGWFAVRSPGADGSFEGHSYEAGFTSSAEEDLVHLDFYAIRRPPVMGTEQAETLEEIRVLGTTIFSWVADNLFQGQRGFPNRGFGGEVFDVGTLVPLTHASLEALLVPLYIPCLIKKDFWGNDYDYWLDTSSIFAVPLTGIRSTGSDGLSEGPIYNTGPFPAAQTEQDLLWVDGLLLRFPDQTLIFLDGFESGTLDAWSSAAR